MAAVGDITRVFSGPWHLNITFIVLSIFLTTFNPSLAQSGSTVADQSVVTTLHSVSSSAGPTNLPNRPTPTSVLNSSPATSSADPSPSPTSTPLSADPYMIFANYDIIYRVGLDESNFVPLISGSSLSIKTVAIDYDIRRNILFWSDVTTRRIIRSRLDGSNPQVIVENGLSVADGLAWDWVGQKLYWTDSKHREIEVADIYTGYRTQLIQTGNDTTPRALILDPNTRYMYWTDWGKVAKIERMSMDGTLREVLHDTDLVWPNGITLDYATQTLYWVDANLDKIESSFTNGSHRRLVSEMHIYHPFSIAFFGNVLYWSDWSIDQVIYAPLSLVSNVASLTPQLKQDPFGIRVVSVDAQPINAENPCEDNNGNCSHLCLLSAASNRSYSCACPDGAQLDDNGTQCVYGSCRGAGYSSCCTSGLCEGHGSPVCFCDIHCLVFSDCCPDFTEICDTSPSTTGVVPIVSPTEHLVTPLPTSSEIISPSVTETTAIKTDGPIPSSMKLDSNSGTPDLMPPIQSSMKLDSNSGTPDLMPPIPSSMKLDSNSGTPDLMPPIPSSMKLDSNSETPDLMPTSSQTVLGSMSSKLLEMTVSEIPKESRRLTAIPNSSEMNLQASSNVSMSSSEEPRGSQTISSTFSENSQDGNRDGRSLLFGVVGVVSLLMVLIVVILSLVLLLFILRRKALRGVVSSASFGNNASFDGIGGLSRKSSFGESMDSGVDLDIKVESKV